MLYIDYEDLDNSLKYIKADFMMEDRLLDKYELIQLEQLQHSIEKEDSEDKERRLKKLNSILEIHETKVNKLFEYLKNPFSDVPSYPENKKEYDLRRFRIMFTEDILLNFAFHITNLRIKEKESSSIEEPSVFIGNCDYLFNSIVNCVEYISGDFEKIDYPEVFRIMDLNKSLLNIEEKSLSEVEV